VSHLAVSSQSTVSSLSVALHLSVVLLDVFTVSGLCGKFASYIIDSSF